MALTDRLPFEGTEVALVAENFATMADAHRLAGGMPPEADQQETADGRDKSLGSSRARLARVVGRDARDAGDARWDALARHIAELQMRRLHDACARVLSRPDAAAAPWVVGCGAGSFLAERLAARLGLAYRDFVSFVPLAEEVDGYWISACAPAVSVACLAAGL
jgi:probable H4MPT-linked C1 transfer pathway protein